jgi:Leucine-rich repeat (LRR) protein
VNNQPEDPEKKKRRVSPVEEVPTPKQDEEQKWLLERTGLSTINDLTTLTKLNLPNCGLSTLPVNLSDLLPNLSILFAPKNHFEELPEVIGKCSNLQVRKKIRDFLEASSPVQFSLSY